MKLRASCIFLVGSFFVTVAGAGAAHAADPPAYEGDSVKVHVDATEAVPLEHRADATAPWEHACDAPCDATLPVAHEYRFAATISSPESAPFKLDARNAASPSPSEPKLVTIHAELADKKKKALAPWILGGSAALVVGGIVVFIAGIRPSETFDANGVTHDGNFNVAAIGSVLIAAGVAGGAVGGSFYFNNQATRASGAVQRIDAPTRGGSAPPPRGLALTLPVWSATF